MIEIESMPCEKWCFSTNKKHTPHLKLRPKWICLSVVERMLRPRFPDCIISFFFTFQVCCPYVCPLSLYIYPLIIIIIFSMTPRCILRLYSHHHDMLDIKVDEWNAELHIYIYIFVSPARQQYCSMLFRQGASSDQTTSVNADCCYTIMNHDVWWKWWN